MRVTRGCVGADGWFLSRVSVRMDKCSDVILPIPLPLGSFIVFLSPFPPSCFILLQSHFVPLPPLSIPLRLDSFFVLLSPLPSSSFRLICSSFLKVQIIVCGGERVCDREGGASECVRVDKCMDLFLPISLPVGSFFVFLSPFPPSCFILLQSHFVPLPPLPIPLRWRVSPPQGTLFAPKRFGNATAWYLLRPVKSHVSSG